MKSQVQLANEFISRRAKAAALLNAVHELKMKPPGMTAYTTQIWDALCFIGAVIGDDSTGWEVSSGGNAMREVFNLGE